ncbi:hypothetical protein ACFXJ8_28775 [Nonomuraea sp. NPDC059194]|uniref:hypothetical protein n=1 Tax=Nonomuraea sp. NPDC059194 TaxID=3346764 RepID=UPI003688A5CE
MKLLTAVVAIIGSVALLVALAIGVPVAAFLLTYGCHENEDRLAVSLSAHGIFDNRPSGAQPYGERKTSCEEDDRIVDVQQIYRLPAGRNDVLDFYREVAARDGWKPSAEDDANGLCSTKAIDGEDVALSVWLNGSGTFSVSLSSSVEDGGWC